MSIEVQFQRETRLEAFHRKNLVKAKEDIMLMLQRIMNHPERDPDMKVKILQVRMNMF